MKTISILGSTGSIGTSALDIVRQHPDEFKVFGLSAGSNVLLLAKQALEFRPKVIHIADETKADDLRKIVPDQKIKIVAGDKNIYSVFDKPEVDLVVLAITGIAALKPLIKAIDLYKNIALANKEAIVAAGEIVREKAKEKGVKIFPVDSEHSAIWQCLECAKGNPIKRVLLTASGGAFRNKNLEELKNVTPEEAIFHPRWKMGKKITVDSGTLMNKGLELIEAMKLFDLPFQKIEVLVHPQSIIHSAIEFLDGSVMAQMGPTDMRLPIQYALTYPKRIINNVPALDFIKLRELTFERPKFDNFPCLNLAFKAAELGGTAPAILNAANEVAVRSFLAGKIRFTDIPVIVEAILNNGKIEKVKSVEQILKVSDEAKLSAERKINQLLTDN